MERETRVKFFGVTGSNEFSYGITARRLLFAVVASHFREIGPTLHIVDEWTKTYKMTFEFEMFRR